MTYINKIGTVDNLWSFSKADFNNLFNTSNFLSLFNDSYSLMSSPWNAHMLSDLELENLLRDTELLDVSLSLTFSSLPNADFNEFIVIWLNWDNSLRFNIIDAINIKRLLIT